MQEPWSHPGAGFCSHTVPSPTANPVAGIFKTDLEPTILLLWLRPPLSPTGPQQQLPLCLPAPVPVSLRPPLHFVPYVQPEEGCEHLCQFMFLPCLESSCGSISLRGEARVLATALEPWANWTVSRSLMSSPSPSCSLCSSTWTSLLLLEHAGHTPASGPLHLLLPLAAMLFPQIFSQITPYLIQGFGLKVTSSKTFSNHFILKQQCLTLFP